MKSVSEYVANPALLLQLTAEEMYAMPRREVIDLQIGLLERRFEEVLPKVQAVRRLADETGIRGPNSSRDITAMCLPHTFYKSYSLRDVEEGRFGRLTRWLQALSVVDLSAVDTSVCDSLESWIDAIGSATTVRLQCSSGTGGKISFYPRTVVEERYFIRNFLTSMGGFRDELDSGLQSGEVEFVTPWPFATGHHNIPILLRLLREHVYAGRSGNHIHMLGTAHWNVDVMWLTSRLRAADAKGDAEGAQAIRRRLAALIPNIPNAAETARAIDNFLHTLVSTLAGRKAFLFGAPAQLYSLALECERRGVKPSFASDSFVFCAGRANSKGDTLPDDWMDHCQAVFSFDSQGAYAMTESTQLIRLCKGDHFHPAPWIYIDLLNPSTGEPLPRSGVQTGRLAIFDLLPENYWAGTLTGDRVSVNWDGGCMCGRIGPYIYNDVTRIGSLKDDDKINCSKTADAYDKAVDYVLGQTHV